MIALDIPGFAVLCLEHLVLDFNGTLAVDGSLLSGVGPLLAELAEQLQVHVLTADTFGRPTAQVAGLPVRLTVVRGGDESEAKLRYVQSLTSSRVVAIGNGRNDVLMLGAAAIGIAVVQREGGVAATIGAADVIATSVLDALELIRSPRRLMATLRS